MPSGQKHAFHTGEAFTETLNDVRHGVSGDKPAVLIITRSGVKDIPTFKAEPGQKPEY